MQLLRTNKNRLLFLGTFLFTATLLAQPMVAEGATITQEQFEDMVANEDTLKEWLEVVQTPGVIVKDNKMIFSDEAQKLAQDANYRALVYKENYSLLNIKESIQKFEIQKAFWYMINLYPDNKEQMLQFIYAYDKVVPSDKLTTASFYTYAFFDPRITKIKEGKPEVYRPDLFEEYFRITKEIVSYVALLREQENTTK